MMPSTINELAEWMTKNCYGDKYAIGNRGINEGFGLEKFGSLYVWFYTERGARNNLNYFTSEKEAVKFAFGEINRDRLANAHSLAIIKENDEKKKEELINELEKRNIEYLISEIPYGGLSDKRYVVSVFGCDIELAKDLQEKYKE